MWGLSSHGKESIENLIEDMFDQISLQFIGNIPKLQNKKLMVISSQPNLGLAHLFIQAMANRTPNPLEKDILKGLLNSSHGYIESLKNRTKSNISERIDGIAREANIKKRPVKQEEIQEILNEEMKKARTHMQAIAESESTKLRNLGSMMNITRVAGNLGDFDPTVFFVVIKDNTTCKECIKLHLMPDGVTPKLWKFSELKQGYHKRGEEAPSAFGLHPHCRCTLTYLSKGFSFDKEGKVAYKAENHDEHANQQSVS